MIISRSIHGAANGVISEWENFCKMPATVLGSKLVLKKHLLSSFSYFTRSWKIPFHFSPWPKYTPQKMLFVALSAFCKLHEPHLSGLLFILSVATLTSQYHVFYTPPIHVTGVLLTKHARTRMHARAHTHTHTQFKSVVVGSNGRRKLLLFLCLPNWPSI